MQVVVTGRNGFKYPAKHVKGNLYRVGKFIVTVEAGKVVETVCRATKANFKLHAGK